MPAQASSTKERVQITISDMIANWPKAKNDNSAKYSRTSIPREAINNVRPCNKPDSESNFPGPRNVLTSQRRVTVEMDLALNLAPSGWNYMRIIERQ